MYTILKSFSLDHDIALHLNGEQSYFFKGHIGNCHHKIKWYYFLIQKIQKVCCSKKFHPLPGPWRRNHIQPYIDFNFPKPWDGSLKSRQLKHNQKHRIICQKKVTVCYPQRRLRSSSLVINHFWQSKNTLFPFYCIVCVRDLELAFHFPY